MISRSALVSRRIVLAAGVALVTAGCVGTVDSSSGTELVWITGGITAADHAPALEVVNLWNALRPNGPRIRVEGLPQFTNGQRQVLASELNAGLKNFDIFDLDVIWLPEFAQRGWLVDLQDLRLDLARASLPGPMQTAIWDGTLWATPSTTDAGILYYRSDLIDKPPATWEELIDVGRRVGEQNGIAPFVAADGAQSEGLVVQYLEYFWGLGGEVFDRDGRSILFQLDKAVQAAEFMRTAFREGVYAPGFNTMSQEDVRITFQSGEAVFLRSWPYAYQLMNGGDPDSQVAGKIGIAPLPAFNGHRPVAALGGHNLAVSAFSRNIPAATEFVKFASTSRDVQLRGAQRHSLAPTLKAVYHSLAADPMMALLAQVLPTAKPRPAIPEWAAVSAEMQQQVFAAYTGTREPKTAVKELRDFLVATADGG
jgi:multiple sugar transport system substrate-binding protein